MRAVKRFRDAILLAPALAVACPALAAMDPADFDAGPDPIVIPAPAQAGAAATPVRPGAGPAQGGAQGAAPPAKPWSLDACKTIYKDKAYEVRNRLFSFEPVYGKASLFWTAEDYDAVVALAQACNGVTMGAGDKFDSRPWPGMINVVRARMLPVAQTAKEIARRASLIKPDAIRLPPCQRFLEFKVDAYENSDNSAAIFGQSFLAMGMADLERAVSYANLCLAYLPDYAQIAAGWRKEVTRDLLGRIMDRALIVQKRRQEWEALPRYETDLVLDRDGVVVPTTMTSPDAREMVARFNKSSAMRRPFSPEAIGQLLRMAEDVLHDDRSAFDKMYAEAVRARCQQEIFRK